MYPSELGWLQSNYISWWKSGLDLWFQPKVMPSLVGIFQGKNRGRGKFWTLNPLIFGKLCWWVIWMGCCAERKTVLAFSTLAETTSWIWKISLAKLWGLGFFFKKKEYVHVKTIAIWWSRIFQPTPPTLFYWIVSTRALHLRLSKVSPLCLCLCNPATLSTTDKFAEQFPADLQADFISNSSNS